MSKTERISLWRSDLLLQYSQKTGETSVEESESIFSDEIVSLAIDLGLALA